jgi:glycosyltransferase involved in cell wall biosynthesis
LRVLFVASGNSPAGLNVIVRNQGESLSKLGIQIEYFPIVGRGIKNYLKHIPLLRSFLRDSPFEIIHAHYGLCGIVSSFARNKEKLVISFMGDDLLGEVKDAGKYSFTGEIFKSVNKLLAINCDFSIVKSDQMFSQIKNVKNVSLIPNGIDLSKFEIISKHNAKQMLGLDDSCKYIIFLANPSRKEKNYKLAEESVNNLNSKKIKLIAVHSVNHNLLKYYYSAAELLLLTSYHEGSPNVIKEAMACNCPIVSTNVGDVNWVLGNTEGCFLTSFKVEEISQKIQQALNFAKKDGRTKGRERILQLGLSSETIANKVINVYNMVLNS